MYADTDSGIAVRGSDGVARRADTSSIERLLQSGAADACRKTLVDFFDRAGFFRHASPLMRLYTAMDIYILASSFCGDVGIDSGEFTRRFGRFDDIEGKLADDAECLDYFCSMLTRCVEWRAGLIRGNTGDVIQSAKRYIEERYTQEDLSLKSVAAAMNFSPTYFSTLFKKETGVNFINYLTQVRISKAKSLLCCTSKLVYEVAYEVGFSDYRYFSQIFKRYTGQTPREFQCSCNR